MPLLSYPSPENQFQQRHALLLISSYCKFFGRPMMSMDAGYSTLAEQVFHDCGAVVSHNIANDPIFNYANLTALRLFEMTWNEMTALPSRQSAEPVNRDERARLLAAVNTNGCINNYQGIRISKTGKRFKIQNAVVWNLIDEKGVYQGQAAYFKHWRFLD